MLAVLKKDGTYRVCVDFRKLDDNTVPDRHSAACMQSLIDGIAEKKIYSSTGLLPGFLQVQLDEGSRNMTALSTPRVHYDFVRMLFGLQGLPITFYSFGKYSLLWDVKTSSYIHG